MKLPYLKPQFGQILLDGTSGGSTCDYGVSYAWLECPITIPGEFDPIFGTQIIVFQDDMSGVCNTYAQMDEYICKFNGKGTSVFGS